MLEPNMMQEDDTRSKVDRNTLVLNDPIMKIRRTLSQQPARGNSTLQADHELILLIRGISERVMIKEGVVYYLGRVAESDQDDAMYIDLSAHGAAERGVSRIHARLYVYDQHIYLVDEGSTNGTYLFGQALPPHTPTMLHKGDEITLGRLLIQFLFH
jgi:pSer/pThr/pTyr-binding forkhead associated (FHA) protein